MSLSKQEAIYLLVDLFNSNKLSFREIKLLKRAFDEAVITCNEGRSENIAEYFMGRGAKPSLADIDTENDFFDSLSVKAEKTFASNGIKVSGLVLESAVELAADIANFSSEDFFYSNSI